VRIGYLGTIESACMETGQRQRRQGSFLQMKNAATQTRFKRSTSTAGLPIPCHGEKLTD
jgi:hypothetical protein